MKKKKDNTTKKVIIASAIAFVALVLLVAYQTEQANKKLEESGVTTMLARASFIDSSTRGNSVIVIGMESCPYCQQALPVMAEAAKQTNTTIHYIDLDNVDSETRDYVASQVSEQVGGGWGVPLTLAFSNGEVVDQLSGLADLDTYIQFFGNYAEEAQE